MADDSAERAVSAPQTMLPLGIVGAVVCLFFARRPTTVLRRVVAVIVDTLYGRILRWFAHVGNECGKRRVPPRANANTAPAVSRKMSGIRILATLTHPNPRTVSEWRCAAIGMTVERIRRALRTAATRTLAVAQALRSYDALRSAFATTQPNRLFTLTPGICENGPTPEPLPDERHEVVRRVMIRHANILTQVIVSHER